MTNVTNVNSVSNDIAITEAVFDDPIGITAPPIDELLDKVSSKYALVIFAAKRARQINSYFQQADVSLLENLADLYKALGGGLKRYSSDDAATQQEIKAAKTAVQTSKQATAQ